jgi:protein TonB
MALTVADIQDVPAHADVAPVPTKTPAPRYPSELRQAGVSGLVVIAVVIDEKGDVVASEVKKSSQFEFEAPALKAIAQWKFKPAKLGDNAVKALVSIPIRFNAEE